MSSHAWCSVMSRCTPRTWPSIRLRRLTSWRSRTGFRETSGRQSSGIWGPPWHVVEASPSLYRNGVGEGKPRRPLRLPPVAGQGCPFSSRGFATCDSRSCSRPWYPPQALPPAPPAYGSPPPRPRRVPGLFVEQLLSVVDVTARMDSALRGVTGDEALARARDQAIDTLGERLTAAARDSSVSVQIVSLYEGAQYSAYTYRRYGDVRLVLVPELGMGFFGGDDDNFTYPRYDLDFSVYRVYDASGKPLETPSYFRWSRAGTSDGDAVFVVGNPGSTSRLETVAQLAYTRDVQVPATLDILKSRIAALEAFSRAAPAEAAARRVATDIFGYANSVKAYEGQLAGLRDPLLLGRRRLGEAGFRAEITRRPPIAAQAALFDAIAAVEAGLTRIGGRIYAFPPSPSFGSSA